MRRTITPILTGLMLSALTGTALGAECPGQCQTITSNPLKVVVTADSALQIYYQDGTEGQVYSPSSPRGNAGTWVGVDSTVYGPDNMMPVSQSGVTGTGTAADPYTVVTEMQVGTNTGLRLTEVLRVVNGNPWFRIDRRVTNSATTTRTVRVFHYADLYLLGSDSGYGYYDPTTGAVGGQNAAANFFQAFIPITPAANYMEGRYSDVRSAVGSAAAGGASLPNTWMPTTDPANLVDNGAALQWNVTLGAGASRTVSDFWSFGATPQIPAVTAPPAVSGVQPAQARPGATVTVTGSRFGATTGSVTVGGTPAPIVSWSDPQVVFRVPSGLAPGSRPIVVSRADEAGDPEPFTVRAGRNLANTITSPRIVSGGPATATFPGRISLGDLRSSKCVRVMVRSSRPARVMVTIYSGRKSIRLFGQKRVTFTKAGRKVVCIAVPKRARTFNVRTPLHFAMGWKVGAKPRIGEPSPAPRTRTISLVP